MGNGVGRSGGYFAGVRAGLPFALVVGVVGFSFGALARSLGWGVIAPIAFSVATFSVTGGGPRPDRAARRAGAGRKRGGAPGLEGKILVSALWVSILAVTLASAAIKAAGPILAGGRELPPRANGVLALLTPALLAALVVTGTFGEGGHPTTDEKALGVGVAAASLALRAPVIVAAVVTALSRLSLG